MYLFRLSPNGQIQPFFEARLKESCACLQPRRAIYQLRVELWGGEVILFVAKEAARAALREGAAKNKVALIHVPTMLAVAARCDIAP